VTFDPVAIRAWRVRLVTWFPKTLLSDMSKGMPDKLEFGTRVGKSSANVNGVSVSLGPAAPAAEDSADLIAPDPVFLTFDVAAVGAVDALEVAQPVIDTVIDDLSFQLQEPLRISSMTVLDLTPPVTAGDEREFMQYTGYDQFKLSRSTAMGTTHTVLVPSLRANYAELSRRTQDALDWYIKAMHTPWDADRYIFTGCRSRSSVPNWVRRWRSPRGFVVRTRLPFVLRAVSRLRSIDKALPLINSWRHLAYLRMLRKPCGTCAISCTARNRSTENDSRGSESYCRFCAL
jgi:hypothetical protein